MGDEPKRIQEELRWLAGVLGEARNLDVLLMKAKDSDLRAKLKDARNKAYNDAVEALGSARARALIIDFNEWLQCDLDRTGGSATSEDTSASEFAARAIEKMRKKLKKHGSALAETDDEHRHQVRKDAKKLRYAAEFFGSLFDDKRGTRRHRKFRADPSRAQVGPRNTGRFVISAEASRVMICQPHVGEKLEAFGPDVKVWSTDNSFMQIADRARARISDLSWGCFRLKSYTWNRLC
ncbi:UNVERIFIED_ORG: inorganic triphosphatase YgiF [Rhizobium sophorae]|nr:inorganic triphosphatase YgiF [Rhizobium leguminosarum]MDH6663572.1 inorganic triphosphatase YgiF [Rhizobium sophorae]